jgi:hypothetical protein
MLCARLFSEELFERYTEEIIEAFLSFICLWSQARGYAWARRYCASRIIAQFVEVGKKLWYTRRKVPDRGKPRPSVQPLSERWENMQTKWGEMCLRNVARTGASPVPTILLAGMLIRLGSRTF